MRREPSNIFFKFGLYLFLFVFSSNLLAQRAWVVSEDTTICESGVISFKVKFRGTAPFGIYYQTVDEDGTHPYQRLSQDDEIGIEDLDADSVWTENISIFKTTKFTILKVYDATIDRNDNSDPGNPAWYDYDGIDVTGEEMDIVVDSRTSPDAGADISALCGYTATEHLLM